MRNWTPEGIKRFYEWLDSQGLKKWWENERENRQSEKPVPSVKVKPSSSPRA